MIQGELRGRLGYQGVTITDAAEGQAVVAALASALDGGQLNSATFAAAVQRVTALRNGL